MQVNSLKLFCKHGEETVDFGPRASFFYGEMSSGKSTIVELLDYCLGGNLVRTPAVSSELISVHLEGVAGGTRLLIERSLEARSSVEVSWKCGEEAGRETFPIQAGQNPVQGEDVFNYSDFMLKRVGLPLLKVRRSKRDPESDLWRVSFRDFLEFCYLDQMHLDSSFFLLEQPIRAEKSKDVLRFTLGFHSERLNQLQGELSELRQQQRVMRETANQVGEFLEKYGFDSQEDIETEIAELIEEGETLEKAIEQQSAGIRSNTTVAEDDEAQLERLNAQVQSKTQAVGEITVRIEEQESLIAEFISMKLKTARSVLSSELLGQAPFEACPSCGTRLEKQRDADQCSLCKSPLAEAPGRLGFETPVVERDLSDRIEELKRSVARLRRSLERQSRAAEDARQDRAEVQARLDLERGKIESEYMRRARRLEARLGGVRERVRLLNRLKEMPTEVSNRIKRAEELNVQISEINRKIEEEEARFERGRENVRVLENNFHGILKAIHFPEVTDDDAIIMNLRRWMPEVYPNGREERAWTFDDAGSGGKMVLFKISFALALHLTAAQRGLPLPKFLIIDSTMKNITPDVNPEVFENFYVELYRLAETDLSEWQMILIDQTFSAPPDSLKGFVSRKLTIREEDYPPLISYYRGH